MKIMIINPNTHEGVTKRIEESLKSYKRVDVELCAVNPQKGPVGIESHYHKYLATVEILPMIQEAERENYDAVIIACFGDPGLDAARELVNIPVVGIS